MTLARFPNKNQAMSTEEMEMTSEWEDTRPKNERSNIIPSNS